MEVTRHNFPSLLGTIEEKIKKCSFISLDLELSGLRSKPGYVNRLFDTAAVRYNKYREGTTGIVITQIGLSLFHHDIDKNTCTASTYTFHLTPQTVGPIEQSCTFQASVFDFLQRNKFDFNTFAYEGIPYLNKDEETVVEKLISQESIAKHLRYEDIEEFQVIKSKIEKWFETASTGEVLKFKVSTLLRLFIAKQCVKAYPLLKTSINNDEIIIEKILPGQTKSKNVDTKSFDESLLQYALGFSLIVKMLERARKPLVFHNAFGDVLFFYNQFIEPLPASYKRFKCNVNKLFPYIYDNKLISNKLKNNKNEYIFNKTSLEIVYSYFKEPNGRYVKPRSPSIKFETGFEATPWFHHAGWDAYCTGFCFVKLCHWLGCDHLGTIRTLTTKEHLAGVKSFCNKIYLSRAAQPHICLDDSDPSGNRPPNLHIKTLKNETIDISEVVEIVGKFGSVDVKRYGKNTALIAVTGSYTAKKIFQTMKDSKDFKVSYFNIVNHSPTMRLALWTGFVVSSTSLLALIFTQLRK